MDYEAFIASALSKYYPDTSDRSLAEDVLSQYSKWEELRVRLAVLKLAEGNLDKLERNIALAQQDYRDVLAAAEYPNTFGAWNIKKNDPDKYKALQQQDQEQYDAWIASLD